jgi:hypothetical protein
MPTRETANDAKNAEFRLGLIMTGVAVLAVITVLGYGLAKWRQADTRLDTSQMRGARDIVDSVTVFVRFPDWWLADALASYGEFVTNHWVGILEIIGGAVLLFMFFKKALVATK